MEKQDTTEQFVRQLTEHQSRRFGYVYSLLGDRSRAEDVVQESNLVLWRKFVGREGGQARFLGVNGDGCGFSYRSGQLELTWDASVFAKLLDLPISAPVPFHSSKADENRKPGLTPAQPPSPRQRPGYPLIGNNGGVVVGQNGGQAFPAGTQIPPTQVQIIRPNNLPQGY